MVQRVAAVMFECVKTPGQTSVWSKTLARYVCAKDPEFKAAVQEQARSTGATLPTLSPAFKLVFLSAFGGTIFFVLLCLGVHLWVGAQMPTATEKFVDGLFSMAQIGFGATCGLLGGQVLRAEVKP